MCTGQTKGGTPVEKQTMGGTPSEESTRGSAPSEEYFLDKLPIGIDWTKVSVGSKLSAESSETPNEELFKGGNWTGEKNPSAMANGNFGGTTGKGTQSREGAKGFEGCNCIEGSK